MSRLLSTFPTYTSRASEDVKRRSSFVVPRNATWLKEYPADIGAPFSCRQNIDTSASIVVCSFAMPLRNSYDIDRKSSLPRNSAWNGKRTNELRVLHRNETIFGILTNPTHLHASTRQRIEFLVHSYLDARK